MKKSKRKSPSRIRYEKNNPVVSFRIKEEWKDEFKVFLKDQGLSIGDFFRIAFEKQKANYKRAETRGYNRGYTVGDTDGYKRAVSDWRIWFFCKICDKAIYITPNSDMHKDIIEYMRTRDPSWVHTECNKKNSQGTY